MNKRVNKEDYETPSICKKTFEIKEMPFFIESGVQRVQKKKESIQFL